MPQRQHALVEQADDLDLLLVRGRRGLDEPTEDDVAARFDAAVTFTDFVAWATEIGFGSEQGEGVLQAVEVLFALRSAPVFQSVACDGFEIG